MERPHDEYVDHSCSTPLERLSRDAETALRGWHVASGSDRHVSFHRSSGVRGTKTTKKTKKKAAKRRRSLEDFKSARGSSLRGEAIDEDAEAETADGNIGVGSERSTVVDDSEGVRSDRRSAFQKSRSVRLTPPPSLRSLTFDTGAATATDGDGDGKEDHAGDDEDDSDSDEEFDVDESVSLLRSTTLTLAAVPVTRADGTSERLSVALRLCLWDGPAPPPSQPAPGRADDDNTSASGGVIGPRGRSVQLGVGSHVHAARGGLPLLPLSLRPRWRRRRRRRRRPKNNSAIVVAGGDAGGGDLASSLSSLLGIGQHITLSLPPISDGDASPPSAHHESAERLLLSLALPPLDATATLASMLQCALNCAAERCDCRIPAFGVWGSYDPQLSSALSSGVSAGDASASVGSHSNAATTANVAEEEESVLPEWMIPFDPLTVGADNENYSKQQRQRSDHDNEPMPPPPPQLLPLVAGRCHPGPRARSASGSFSIYYAPSRHPHSSHLWTLDGLARSLLRHSGADHTGNQYGRVVVSRARHTYVWSKRVAEGAFGAMVEAKRAGRRGRKHALLAMASPDESDDEFDEELLREERLVHRGWRCIPDADVDENVVSESKDPRDVRRRHRRRCQLHALRLLEGVSSESLFIPGAAGRRNGMSHMDEPLWGPPNDPLLLLRASARWEEDGGAESVSADGTQPAAPGGLLTLPLRVRSSRALSRRDVQEMETSLLRAIFHPSNTAQPGNFTAYDVTFDPECAPASLSASCRCVLAALVRVCSLGPDALLGHLVNGAVLEELGEREAEERHAARAQGGGYDDDFDPSSSAAALAEMVRQSNLGPATSHLVEAMDWKSQGEERHPDEEEVMGEAVRSVLAMAGGRDGAFPSPPEEAFRSKRGLLAADGDDAAGAKEHDIAPPSLKAAPPARLLSLLCRSMASLRTPSGMAALWLSFGDELRRRWERRESVPNLGRVVGLDPDVEGAAGAGGSTWGRFGMGPAERRRFALGLGCKADGAAFVHCSEPDPDLGQCALGQMLQLLNIGVECVVAAEEEELRLHRLAEQHEPSPHQHRRRAHDEGNDYDGGGGGSSVASDGFPPERCSSSVASTEVMGNVTGGGGASLSVGDAASSAGGGGSHSHLSPVREKTHALHSQGAIDVDDEDERSASTNDQFFEAHGENDSLSGSSLGANGDDGNDGQSQQYLGRVAMESTANVTHRQARRGARCPVHGISLIASGDQLYAPYLQRQEPLTEQTLSQRRTLLRGGGSDVQARIQIAHRLQKPKILSDMCSFKAANPGAVFQDFVDWYGNPGDPLEDCDDGGDGSASKVSGGSIASFKSGGEADLDAASESIQVLMATRSFWSDTWDEAEPVPASEQRPLFDAPGTVEYVLDAIETVQPAHLVNQVLAVNLAAAAFALRASAGPALAARVPAVGVALERLEIQTERACAKLGRDVVAGDPSRASSVGADGDGGTERDNGDDGLWLYAKADTIADCESVCDAIGDVEIVLSRAMTLLHKFPGEYDIVQSLLRKAEGKTISVDSISGRDGLMSAVRMQQRLVQGRSEMDMDELPSPSVREYVLRNCNEDNPCQLSARLGEVEGLLLSMTKSERE